MSADAIDGRDRIRVLADHPDARVMVFVDGQNLYKRCKELYGHPLCHPHLLAEYLAAGRRLVSTRFYTGRPNPNKNAKEKRNARNLDRRLSSLRAIGVRVITRQLRYHWTWGPQADQNLGRPGPTRGPLEVWMEAYERPQEKGIDMSIGLDAVEFALKEYYDVAIIVSLDRDLHEIPSTLRNLRKTLPKPVRVEAAVPVPPGQRHPKILEEFNFTHQISAELFDHVRDDTNYAVEPAVWRPPKHPRTLADL